MANLKWVPELFATIDTMNAENFAEYITEDGEFRWGNFPGIFGRKEIIEFVTNFFASIKGISHEVQGYFGDENDEVVAYGVVTYTRHNDTKLAVPFANIFKMEGGKVKHYWVHIDSSKLYEEDSTQ